MEKTQKDNEGEDHAFNPEQQEAEDTLALMGAEYVAEMHWSFIEELLRAHGGVEQEITVCKFHYKSAFIHGWKHGVEHEKGKR